MIKIYFIAPLIALAIFAGVYSRYAKIYHARLEHEREVEVARKKRKLEEQVQAQLRAHHEATEALARRQVERAEKDRVETAQKKARQEAEQRRAALAQQEMQLHARLERLRADFASVQESLHRRETESSDLEREQVFLAEYVTQAEANRDSLYALLENYETRDSQRLAAAPIPSKPNRHP